MTLIIVLLVLGAILMFLEIFLPGLVAGILGFLCWVAAVILSYRDFGLQTGNSDSGRGAGRGWSSASSAG